MPTLAELTAAHTGLDEADVAWLHLLVADWQIVADLSFADLVLWVPDRDGYGLWAAAQVRPTTGPTAYVDDLVGAFIPYGRRPLLEEALVHGRIAREGDPEWRESVPVRVEAIPVRRQGNVLGVIARNTNLLGVRTPSRLELAYLQTATELAQMVAAGAFPYAVQRSDHTDSPRVGDGFVRIDASGVVTYASPNALSVYRRLGLSTDLTGLELAATTRRLVPAACRPDEEMLTAVLGGRAPLDTEVGNGSTVLIVRSVPLVGPDGPSGAVVLLRDVTELRSRDRELVTKDVTIREIHHRVKNNLQTVAALLRLQARRLSVPQAREALDEAVRRVGTIALVHEILSQSLVEEVDFDVIVDRLLAMVSDLGAGVITSSRRGTFGVLAADSAMPLAMVLTELLQNAGEHGLADQDGHIEVVAARRGERLQVDVVDDGAGLPEGFDTHTSGGLGLSIVRTLVESELDGSLTIGPSHAGKERVGTRVRVVVPLRQPRKSR